MEPTECWLAEGLAELEIGVVDTESQFHYVVDSLAVFQASRRRNLRDSRMRRAKTGGLR